MASATVTLAAFYGIKSVVLIDGMWDGQMVRFFFFFFFFLKRL